MAHPELTAERVLELLWMQLGGPERLEAAVEADGRAAAAAAAEVEAADGDGAWAASEDATGGGPTGPSTAGGPEDLAGCRMS
jgi:hypothetical protein